jgi:hypothetical protein
MLDCQHATQLASQSMERRLPFRQRMALWFHLRICDACSEFVRQLRWMRVELLQWRRRVENDVSLHLSEEARARLTAAMQAQAQDLETARRNPDLDSID